MLHDVKPVVVHTASGAYGAKYTVRHEGCAIWCGMLRISQQVYVQVILGGSQKDRLGALELRTGADAKTDAATSALAAHRLLLRQHNIIRLNAEHLPRPQPELTLQNQASTQQRVTHKGKVAT